jgi:hypothetical protein
MTKTDLAIEIAQSRARTTTRRPDVRIQAMFALTSKRQEGLAERALQQVLDDPRIAQDPLRLAAVVGALQNLEAGGLRQRTGSGRTALARATARRMEPPDPRGDPRAQPAGRPEPR